LVTQKLGKNPDKWIDVKKSLPLLTKQKWFSKAKHGYARGKEPVIYPRFPLSGSFMDWNILIYTLNLLQYW
jgi:hypothetical protein